MNVRIGIFWVLFFMAAIFTPSVFAASETGLRCVVIDAGHGGKDPGAVSGKIYEKDINLGVALKLGKKIEENLSGVRVVYTRKDDRFLELSERSRIAAAAGADIFISIHTNASPSAKPTGTETYVMGEDKDNRNLNVVMRENSVIALEPDYTSRYEGYDPNSSESVIMFSLLQYAYQTQSLSLAELIQNEYVSHAKRGNKGVKQAGFLVLWKTPMPSVLTEVGFLSNPEEAKFLASQAGQEKMAGSLFNAVKNYKTQLDGRTVARGPAGNGTFRNGSPENAPVEESTAQVSEERVVWPGEVKKEEGKGKNKKKDGTGTDVASTPKEADKGKNDKKEASQKDVVYRIQVKSAAKKLTLNNSNFGSYASKVEEVRIDGRYKYFCESCFSYKEALILQRKVRETFPDAFVVAFRNGVPVPIAQVLE